MLQQDEDGATHLRTYATDDVVIHNRQPAAGVGSSATGRVCLEDPSGWTESQLSWDWEGLDAGAARPGVWLIYHGRGVWLQEGGDPQAVPAGGRTVR